MARRLEATAFMSGAKSGAKVPDAGPPARSHLENARHRDDSTEFESERMWFTAPISKAKSFG